MQREIPDPHHFYSAKKRKRKRRNSFLKTTLPESKMDKYKSLAFICWWITKASTLFDSWFCLYSNSNALNWQWMHYHQFTSSHDMIWFSDHLIYLKLPSLRQKAMPHAIEMEREDYGSEYKENGSVCTYRKGSECLTTNIKGNPS